MPTLKRLIDFDYLNAAHMPLVIAAVDLESGEAVYFDNRCQAIGPEHLLASTAFVPGFPPVEIDGRCLGDPGMFCSLPLDPLLKSPPPGDQLCIAVASQSLRTIAAYAEEHRLRALLARAQARLAAVEGNAELEAIAREARADTVEVVLLSYRPPPHETGAKAIEFSRASIGERWEAGRYDMTAALGALRAGRATRREPGYTFFDCRRGD